MQPRLLLLHEPLMIIILPVAKIEQVDAKGVSLAGHGHRLDATLDRDPGPGDLPAHRHHLVDGRVIIQGDLEELMNLVESRAAWRNTSISRPC